MRGQFVAKQQSFSTKATTEFTGYTAVRDNGKVLELFKDGVAVPELLVNETGCVILDRTPFYAESGGQVGDTGTLTGHGMQFAVIDTVKNNNAHVHYGENLGCNAPRWR